MNVDSSAGRAGREVARVQPAPPRPRRWARPGVPFDGRGVVEAATRAARVAGAVGRVLGLVALMVAWLVRPVAALLSRAAVAVVWVALPVVLVWAAASGGPGSGAGWAGMSPLLWVLSVGFVAATVAVLVAGQVTHHRRTARLGTNDRPARVSVDQGDDLGTGQAQVGVQVSVHGWVCARCAVLVEVTSAGEAAALGGAHDAVWHGGHLTAQPLILDDLAATGGRLGVGDVAALIAPDQDRDRVPVPVPVPLRGQGAGWRWTR